MAKKKKKTIDCRPTYEVSQAGHLLATRGFSKAGKILSVKGKYEKAKRIAKGCLNGPPGTFKLTDKQKKNLPPALQKAILANKRKQGLHIIN